MNEQKVIDVIKCVLEANGFNDYFVLIGTEDEYMDYTTYKLVSHDLGHVENLFWRVLGRGDAELDRLFEMVYQNYFERKNGVTLKNLFFSR